VPILTSAVIECHRAGLGSTAFNLASILMRPLHRPHLDPKYKRKIESVVRKPVRDPESPEAATPCPHCNQLVNESELTCSRCKNHIPFCLVTVRNFHSACKIWNFHHVNLQAFILIS
jgi:WD repeat-containing protein 19